MATRASKALRSAFGLARQADLGEHGHCVAKSLGCEIGVIAADNPGLLESAHPAQAGRRRNADPPSELDIGHAPVTNRFRKMRRSIRSSRFAASGPLSLGCQIIGTVGWAQFCCAEPPWLAVRGSLLKPAGWHLYR